MIRKTQRILQLASFIAGTTLALNASAVDGKWNVNNAGNWSATANWTNNQVAGGVGSLANISFNITAGRTVTIDTTPRTVGRLRFNDDSTPSHDWTLAASGGGYLTMQVASGIPTIEVGNQTATINAQIFGTQGILKTGGGTLNLNNASNAYTGKTIAGNATLRINSDFSLGPVPGIYVADQLTLTNNASLMNNNSQPVIATNRGITLGTGGGGLVAGWGRPFTINSIIAGTGGLTIRTDPTPGRISLNAANIYTGPTVVGHTAAGSRSTAWLELNGSTAAASSVTVITNGSLGGIGTVNGPLVVSTNGIISPGPLTGPGTLTINNSAVMSNAKLNFDLANTTTVGGGVNDLLSVSGALTLVGPITVTINPLSGTLAPGPYTLINCGSLDASLATITCDNPRYGATFDTSSPGQLKMTIANGTPVSLVWSGTGGTNWDVATSINWVNGATPDVFYQGDKVTFDDTGLYTNAAGIFEVAPVTSLGTLLPSAVTIDTTNDFTLTTSQNSRLGGAMSLYKGGSGILTLTGSGSQPNIYDGITVVTNGTLKPGYTSYNNALGLGSVSALGSTNGGTIITNLGRLDMNGLSDVYEPITVAGAGPDGAGAIINSGAATVNNGLRGEVTMVGDTTIGPNARSDIYGGKLNGNGYKLTKKGTAEAALANLGDTGLGDIEIQQGILTLLGNVTAGLNTKQMTIVSNAVCIYYNLNNPTTPIDKAVAMTNGIWRSNSGTNYHTGQVTMDGTNELGGTGVALVLNSAVTGPGTLRKTGASTLSLLGTNTYTGYTSIEAGSLALGPSAALGSTPLINLSAAGSTFDVSALPSGFTLASGQTLAGIGSVTGLVTAVSGSTLVPGTSPGTLTFQSGLALNGGSGVFELSSSPASGNDQVVVNGVGLTASGVTTLKIAPLGALDTVNPYTLFLNNGTALPSGSEANFAVTTDSRYNFNVLPTDNSLGTSVQVLVSGSGSAATILWRGNDPTNPTWWDLKTTTNWSNGGSPDKFYLGDVTVFDDSAVGTTAELIGAVQPSLVVLSNASKSITIGGAGSLVSGSLSGDGAGTTTIANTAANTFVFGVTNNSGTLVFANSQANAFGAGLTVNGGTVRIETPVNNTASAIQLNGGALVFNQTNAATVSAPISSVVGTIVKNNTNVLTLSGVNSGFTSTIQVNTGTLRAGSATALGDTLGITTIAPGATLDVNFQQLGFESLIVSGTGVGGIGAIINTGAEQQNALRSVTLAGDTTFGAPVNRWDIRTDVAASPNAVLSTSGNAYNLTKVGPNAVAIVGATVDPALADINVLEGTLGWETVTTSMGDPARTLTIYSNAVLRLWNCTNWLDKQFVIRDGGRFLVGSGTGNTVAGPVTLESGTVTLDVASGAAVLFTNSVSGAAGLTKITAGGATLAASNNIDGLINCVAGTLTFGSSLNAGNNVSNVATLNLYGDATIAGDLVNNGGTTTLSGANSITGSVSNLNGTLILSNNFAAGSARTIGVRYGTTTGGQGTKLALRGGLNTPPGVIGSFHSTSNGGSYRVSIASETLTNTWQGPILLNGEDIVGFYGAPANPLVIKGEILGTNGYTGTAFFRGAAGYCGTVDNVLYAPTATMAITDNAVWVYNHPSNVWLRTSIAYGRLVLGTNNAADPQAPLSLGQTGTSTGTLDLNGFTQSVPSLVTVNGANHFIGSSSTTADSLFIYDGITNVSVLDGRIVDSVAGGTRKVAVTMKSGSLTLLGANTYTGDTLITGGSLALGTNGSLISPLIDVQAGATLDVNAKLPSWTLATGQTLKGNGTVLGALTANFGATVSPGASIGALTVSGSVTMQVGSTNVFEVSKGSTNDVLNAASVAYGGVLKIQNVGAPLAVGDTFKLFSAGSYVGTFNQVTPEPGPGLAWDTSSLNVNGSIKVVLGIPTTPTNITYNVSGSTLTIQWPTSYLGWTAQSNSVSLADTNLWFDIPGSDASTTLNVPIDPGTPKVFYRLRYLAP